MQMKSVKINRVADKKLKELVSILYSEGYFATRAGARDYVKAIYQFCYTIPSKALRPVKNSEHGDYYYCQYKANSRTTWYVLFSIVNEVYIITEVLNNHSLDYIDFISGEKLYSSHLLPMLVFFTNIKPNYINLSISSAISIK